MQLVVRYVCEEFNLLEMKKGCQWTPLLAFNILSEQYSWNFAILLPDAINWCMCKDCGSCMTSILIFDISNGWHKTWEQGILNKKIIHPIYNDYASFALIAFLRFGGYGYTSEIWRGVLYHCIFTHWQVSSGRSVDGAFL